MSRFILPIVLALGLLRPTVAVAQGETSKIGVFDPEVLWKQTEVGKKFNQDLSAARDRFQAQIDKKQEDMEALKSRIRQQQQSLSEDKINEMKKDVIAKQTELERLNEDSTKEMKYQLGEAQSRFQEMIMKTLDAYGKEKLPMVSVVPPASFFYEAAAFQDGQEKYGPYNWRKTNVRLSVFMDAALRHLLAYYDGENFAKDSGVHHLGHAKACIGIIIDGFESGVLIDDRPPKGNAAQILERLCRHRDGTPAPSTGTTPTAGGTEPGQAPWETCPDGLRPDGPQFPQCPCCGAKREFHEERKVWVHAYSVHCPKEKHKVYRYCAISQREPKC